MGTLWNNVERTFKIKDHVTVTDLRGIYLFDKKGKATHILPRGCVGQVTAIDIEGARICITWDNVPGNFYYGSRHQVALDRIDVFVKGRGKRTPNTTKNPYDRNLKENDRVKAITTSSST